MKDEDWKVILDRIRDGKCTPFLGAGVNYGVLPLGAQIARAFAQEEGFPLRTSEDLASVSQFIAVKYHDHIKPKEKMRDLLEKPGMPIDFNQPDERLDCLRALADLPFPVYLTTNYDNLIIQALQHTVPPKSPKWDICRWHDGLKNLQQPIPVFKSSYRPDSLNPVVFYLHGVQDIAESMVLTEDDYLDFLVHVSRNQKILPARIQEALTTTSLLFVGYRLKDIDFRVLFRGLVQSMDGSQRRLGLTVQFHPPEDAAGDPNAAEEFLANYFGELKVCVYWGTASMFAKELRQRWNTLH